MTFNSSRFRNELRRLERQIERDTRQQQRKIERELKRDFEKFERDLRRELDGATLDALHREIRRRFPGKQFSIRKATSGDYLATVDGIDYPVDLE